MTGRTWVMMIGLLALNWGAFAAALWYGLSRESRKRRGRSERA